MSFADLTLARYSCRSYTNEPVSGADLEQILEAGRIAPSACNRYPTRVLACTTPEQLAAAASAQPRFERDGSVFGAPLVLVVCGRANDAWVRRADEMNAAIVDATIVCDQMMMQATDLGLGTCWVSAFDPAACAQALGLPEGTYPYHMLVVGHAADAIAAADARAARTIAREDFLLRPSR